MRHLADHSAKDELPDYFEFTKLPLALDTIEVRSLALIPLIDSPGHLLHYSSARQSSQAHKCESSSHSSSHSVTISNSSWISVLTCSRKDLTTVNIHHLPKLRATANGLSTMQRRSMTRSQSSMRMPNDCERQPPTGWSSTTLLTAMVITLRWLHQYLVRKTYRLGNQFRVLHPHHGLLPRPHPHRQ